MLLDLTTSLHEIGDDGRGLVSNRIKVVGPPQQADLTIDQIRVVVEVQHVLASDGIDG